jgi:outer membrane protein assembly factor BamD
MRSSAKRTLPLLALAVSLSFGTSGCLFFGHKPPAPLAGMKAAPDKVLYQNAMDDLQHHNFTVGRLDLQTLINTYPDSEYLAKAKLAIANSYYEQGGMDGLTQAVAQYKDFITFFPFLDAAAFAQYRVAMAHFRMMEKPDRDPTQALDAEAELQTMILKYPKSQWTKDATQRLREVQEVLAEGEFEVASFYDLRGADGAAAARLLDLTQRYPLFSEADQANFMLAQIYDKFEKNEFAARFYAKVVREYPLSNLAPRAKRRLIAMGFPVPQPDPKALALMRDEEKYAHDRSGIVRQALGMLKSGPDVSHTAHFGEPNLTPDTNVIAARQVLEPTVVSMVANSLVGGVGSVSASAIGPDSAGTAAAVQPAGSGASDAAGSDQVQSASDPAAPPLTNAAKTKGNGKNPPVATAKKKKKSLFHKLIPF